MTTTFFDTYVDRVAGGERLSPDNIRELARTPDILPLGMLADVLRRRLHGRRVTFLRVASCAFDQSIGRRSPSRRSRVAADGIPGHAGRGHQRRGRREKRRGRSSRGGVYVGRRAERWRAADGQGVLKKLHDAGLDAIAELPLDKIEDPRTALRALTSRGFTHVRLSVASSPAAQRTELLLRAAELQEEFSCIQTLDPLPSKLGA